MKNLLLAVATLMLVIALLVAIFYCKFNSKKIEQDYHKIISELNQKVSVLENQISQNKQQQTATKEWAIYENQKYGFSFKYPKEWKDAERKIEAQNFFTKDPAVSILRVDLVDSQENLKEVAMNEIKKRQCPSDQIIENYESEGILYVTGCGASSELYSYIFKNNDGEIIKLSYHDDFENDWSQEKKLEKFILIIGSISLHLQP